MTKLEAQRDLIDRIISAYHTTRLRETPAADHILSKDRVKDGFATLAAEDEFRAALGAIRTFVSGAFEGTIAAPQALDCIDDLARLALEKRGIV